MSKKQDLTSRIYGSLVVLRATNKNSSRCGYIWQCRCICGNICEKPASYLTTGDTKSCGCLSSYYNSINNGGTGIAGETASLERGIRTSSEYRKWMLLCLEKSGFKSELSGLSGKYEVHHKNSVSYLIKTLNITKDNYLNSVELYDVNNGIVLTKEEHKLFHKKFGLVTTREMWIQFEQNKESFLSLIDRPITKKRELCFNQFKGKSVGSLTLLEEIRNRTGNQYKCQCLCGNMCTPRLSDLKKKDWTHIKTCGKCTRIKKDLSGRIFGYLTVLKLNMIGDNHKAYYDCECTCGRLKVISAENLTRGAAKSCGCGLIKTGPKRR